jgi:hypothetical protein
VSVWFASANIGGMPADVPPTSLVVLQSVQPLTTDVRALGAPDVLVLTDGPEDEVARPDAPVPPRVLRLPREQWPERLAAWRVRRGLEVVTNDEFCLSDAARLRAGLGLRRVTPDGLDGYLDKVTMKTRLAAAGVLVPRWAEVDHVAAPDLREPPSGLVPPLVAKPRVGANSRGVRVIPDLDAWHTWVHDKVGESGWEVEEFVPDPMCFVDGLMVDGTYRPVLVGRYLGGLLPEPGVDVLGAVSVPREDALWTRAANLGRRVAHVLGTGGSFATHLEFFDAGDEPVAMEVCARAPGALVSEMARVVSGINLETAHLAVQAGHVVPEPALTGAHAAWFSVLARADEAYQGPPDLLSSAFVHRMPARAGGGRYVAVMVLLMHREAARLAEDVDRCRHHRWFSEQRQAPIASRPPTT